jgi:hypothetical protein
VRRCLLSASLLASLLVCGSECYMSETATVPCVCTQREGAAKQRWVMCLGWRHPATAPPVQLVTQASPCCNSLCFLTLLSVPLLLCLWRACPCPTPQLLRGSFPASAIKSYPDVFYVEYFAATEDAPGGDLFFFDYGVVACWWVGGVQAGTFFCLLTWCQGSRWSAGFPGTCFD